MVYAHVEVPYVQLVGNGLRAVFCALLVGDCLCARRGALYQL